MQRNRAVFGLREDPFTGKLKFHKGLDIAAPSGTAIYPIKEGEVLFSGRQSGYGNIVVVDHGSGVISKYAHNKVNLVKQGDSVDADTVIAQVGSSGRATGPHLHLEVKNRGESIDPATVVAAA